MDTEPSTVGKGGSNAWALVFVLLLGLLAGVGSFTFGYGQGASYLSNRPEACINCHVMRESYDTYVSSENSMGFHAPQEAARILAESIDLSRKAQAMAIALRAPEAPRLDPPPDTVLGVTPADRGEAQPEPTDSDA